MFVSIGGFKFMRCCDYESTVSIDISFQNEIKLRGSINFESGRFRSELERN